MYLYVYLCVRVRLPKGRGLVNTDSPEHTGLALSVNCSPDTGGIIEDGLMWTPLPSERKREENQQCWAPTAAGPLQTSSLVILKYLCLASVVSSGVDAQRGSASSAGPHADLRPWDRQPSTEAAPERAFQCQGAAAPWPRWVL